jgi:hypothetical protein
MIRERRADGNGGRFRTGFQKRLLEDFHPCLEGVETLLGGFGARRE